LSHAERRGALRTGRSGRPQMHRGERQVMPLGKPLLAALDRMGHGGLVLDMAGQVLRLNETGMRLIKQFAPPGSCEAEPVWPAAALKCLLRSGAAPGLRMDEDVWIVVQRKNKRPIILHAVPIAERATSGAHTVMILVDLESVPRPTTEVLKKIFALTPTEAQVAIELACGKSPEQIAEAQRTTIGTVRKQLASIFAKTQTNRQAELVALLARVAILP
jgi:DNA-binding CsgD family transcriptional regulator